METGVLVNGAFEFPKDVLFKELNEFFFALFFDKVENEYSVYFDMMKFRVFFYCLLEGVQVVIEYGNFYFQLALIEIFVDVDFFYY